MNYKKLFSTILLSAAFALQAAAYTVTPADEAPQWKVDWSGNEARPDWQEPDASAYASFAVMIVTIEEVLQPYVSQDDLLAIFVGDELRGLASPLVKGDGTVDATRFLLKGYSNESADDQVVVTMKYYNAQLKQLFSLSESMTLDEDSDLGIYDDFVPPFTQGCEKYPVTTTFDVASALAEAGITPAEGDIVAVFVGDECRGLWSAGDSPATLTVFLREEGEDVTLKYYDATGHQILTIGDSTEEVVKGDATGDGVVDVSDYIGIANYILGNAPAGFNEKAADVNGDSLVDVSDYIGVANIILYGNVNGK